MQLDVIDTEALPWETWYPQYEGTKCKTLFDDPASGESLKLAFIPSGFTLPQHTRHHHGDTREFVYLLFGDLPYVEYTSPDAPPRVFTFRQGMLLDRPPRSIHGMSIDPVSELGSLVLEWTTGPNLFNYVPFDEPTPGTFNPPWVAETSATPWTPHPGVEGWRRRVLSSGGDEPHEGFHPVSIVHVPATWPSGEEAVVPLEGGGKAWLYVLDGAGAVTFESGADSRRVELTRGTWIRWGDGITARFEPGWTDDLGLTLLCAGNELAAR